MMHANDNRAGDRRDVSAGAFELAAELIARRAAETSDAIESLADELVERQLDCCQNPELAIAVIDELRAMAGAQRATERGWRLSPVVAPPPIFESDAERPKVCFLFIAQQHQILHGVSIAAALARSGSAEVHIAAATEQHLAYVRRLMASLGGARVTYHQLWPSGLPKGRGSIPPKAIALALNLRRLRRFDVFVTPERSSLMLKWMGLRRQLFVHTDHGAGDRAVGYEPRIAKFDLVLLAGEKQRRRMQAAGLIHEGGYAVVGYPKFDVIDAIAQPAPALFAEARPVVLYNPHFHPKLSSWRTVGLQVLEQFAASPDYNLIFAPHVRLFDGAPAAVRQAVLRFADHPNIHVDLGGDRAWDMTYTRMADVYLGDVSSQVYEFLRQPKPCLFLNPQGVDWARDENYAHWKLGPVLGSAEAICAKVDAARASHPAFAAAQRTAFAETFDLTGASSDRAAAVIIELLARRFGGRRDAVAQDGFAKLQPAV